MNDHGSEAIRADLTCLPGIGPRLALLLARAAGGKTVRDLLLHMPDGYTDRGPPRTLAEATPGAPGIFIVGVLRHEKPARPGQPHRVVVADATGEAEVVLFHPGRLPQFPLGAEIALSGKPDRFAGRLVITHPDHVLPAARLAEIPRIEPVWGLTAGLSPRVVHRAMQGALVRLPDCPEWQDGAILRRRAWPSFTASLRAVQAPEQAPGPLPRQRLAYDELLARQIAFVRLRLTRRERPGRALRGDGALRAEALARFGHALTTGQAAALAEIDADLAAPRRMLRLLQGDVGSGKTMVALLAALRAVEAGHQAALLAPTEILARQHHETLSRLSPARVDLLTGAVKGRARARVLAALAAGETAIAVGTHALFQETVLFRDLAVAVIDEQHRFGVDQRLRLGAKGQMTDVLVMTATPIPRTVLLSHWGEIDVSRIPDKPAGRKPIQTTLHPHSRLPEVLAAIERMIARQGRVYWICPWVKDSDGADIAAAEARYAALTARFGLAVRLAHGQQDAADRNAAIADFADGRAAILVATTIVEVGVDVPAANVIVIEHAERFGLAQLHQLRGRVGRGARESYCLLVHGEDAGKTAARRLALLRETEDGFRIADEDFRIRGGGDAIGARQSGLPGYRIADPEADAHLLPMARQDATLLLERDPMLTSPRGRAARRLLDLFGQTEAAATLLAG